MTKSNDNFTLDAANRLYVQDGYTILPEYMTKTSQHFEADAKNLDFGSEEKARKEINSWVEEKTRQKIKDLIDKLEVFRVYTQAIAATRQHDLVFLQRPYEKLVGSAGRADDSVPVIGL